MKAFLSSWEHFQFFCSILISSRVFLSFREYFFIFKAFLSFWEHFWFQECFCLFRSFFVLFFVFMEVMLSSWEQIYLFGNTYISQEHIIFIRGIFAFSRGILSYLSISLFFWSFLSSWEHFKFYICYFQKLEVLLSSCNNF